AAECRHRTRRGYAAMAFQRSWPESCLLMPRCEPKDAPSSHAPGRGDTGSPPERNREWKENYDVPWVTRFRWISGAGRGEWIRPAARDDYEWFLRKVERVQREP